ncbi:MAG: hypothetical protein WDN72_04190 [Alphaproteobacteria bacterium]
MFVKSERALSDFSGRFSLVVRDCRFHTIGKIPTRIEGRLVPVGGKKFLRELSEDMDGIAGVICTPDVVKSIPPELGCAVSDAPMRVAYEIHRELVAGPAFWKSFASRIHASAQIHPTAYIAPNDVVIGEGTVVGPNVSILERTVIGKHCYFGPGTVIGGPAYEVSNLDGRPQLLPQAGGVRIGDHCTFLANVAVAKSIFPLFTEIGEACSFDNLVHVAHDCVLGRGVKMTACAILSGRVTLMDGAYIGPNATVSNGVTVGKNAIVTIGSVVVKDVAEGARVTGNFAIDHRKHLRRQAAD